jgi:hypothetical protein
VIVLKGSGTVVCAADGTTRVNATGNASLASAGTGDVLAGWIGGRWASLAASAFDIATRAVIEHGAAAEPERPGALRAGDLVERLHRASAAAERAARAAPSAVRLHRLGDLERSLGGAALRNRLVRAVGDRVELERDLLGGIVALADVDALRQRDVGALERAGAGAQDRPRRRVVGDEREQARRHRGRRRAGAAPIPASAFRSSASPPSAPGS